MQKIYFLKTLKIAKLIAKIKYLKQNCKCFLKYNY